MIGPMEAMDFVVDRRHQVICHHHQFDFQVELNANDVGDDDDGGGGEKSDHCDLYAGVALNY